LLIRSAHLTTYSRSYKLQPANLPRRTPPNPSPTAASHCVRSQSLIEGAPRFDVIVLVETTSPEEIDELRSSEAFERLGADFVMAARNTRRIGDTEENMLGTFLFNHFTAEDPERALEAWEGLTGWYITKTGVDNSTLLQPIGEALYAFVNYVRLPRGPVHARPAHQAELPHVLADKAARERHGGLTPAVRGRLSGSVIARTVQRPDCRKRGLPRPGYVPLCIPDIAAKFAL
jgi:hypothetical protein